MTTVKLLREQMTRILCQTCGYLIVTLLLVACSGSAKIIANQDPGADFASYKTFDFANPMSTDRGGARSILSTHLMTQTAKQLDARGLQRNRTNPDLVVDFGASMVNKYSGGTQPTTSVSVGRGTGGGGTRTSVGFGVSTGGGTSTTTEGALVISVVERKRSQLVWEATATGRVTDKTMNNLEPAVEAAVADMFAKFPVAPAP